VCLLGRCISKKSKGNKQKKLSIKKMVNEQELHPMAKAMINLQLHTPNAKYTEEERNLASNFIIIQPLHILAYRKQVVIFLFSEQYEDG